MINGYNLGIVNLTNWYSSARSTGRGGIGSPFGQPTQPTQPTPPTQQELATLQKQVYVETISQIQFSKKMAVVSAVGIGVFALASIVNMFRGH